MAEKYNISIEAQAKLEEIRQLLEELRGSPEKKDGD